MLLLSKHLGAIHNLLWHSWDNLLWNRRKAHAPSQNRQGVRNRYSAMSIVLISIRHISNVKAKGRKTISGPCNGRSVISPYHISQTRYPKANIAERASWKKSRPALWQRCRISQDGCRTNIENDHDNDHDAVLPCRASRRDRDVVHARDTASAAVARTRRRNPTTVTTTSTRATAHTAAHRDAAVEPSTISPALVDARAAPRSLRVYSMQRT